MWNYQRVLCPQFMAIEMGFRNQWLEPGTTYTHTHNFQTYRLLSNYGWWWKDCKGCRSKLLLFFDQRTPADMGVEQQRCRWNILGQKEQNHCEWVYLYYLIIYNIYIHILAISYNNIFFLRCVFFLWGRKWQVWRAAHFLLHKSTPAWHNHPSHATRGFLK